MGLVTQIRLGMVALATEIKRIAAELPNTSESPIATIADASGLVLGFEQTLLTSDGQPAKTVHVVGLTTNGKVQITSLDDGNTVEVYADGDALAAGVVLHREFMALGEPIVFTGLSLGNVITSTGGIGGVTEVEGNSAAAGRQATMPLMSYGLNFRHSFTFAFRESTGFTDDRGLVIIANGPLANEVSILTGSGGSIYGGVQENIKLLPWESVVFDTQGNQEYQLLGLKAPIMAQIIANAGGVPLSGLTGLQDGTQWDARLITPLSTDLIGNPRSGNASALRDGTKVSWWSHDSSRGELNGGQAFSPGSPVDIDATQPTGTGLGLGGHNPAGYVRMRSNAPFTAYSGADGSGGDAAPFYPVSAMSQRLAQPLYIIDSGQADESSIVCFGPYEGTVRIYEYDEFGVSVLAYTMFLTRGFPATTADDQLCPAACILSNTNGNTNNTPLIGNLRPGYIESDVPIGVIVQSRALTAGSHQLTVRSQGGTTASTILSVQDETMVFGHTPSELKAVIRRGPDGLLYKEEVPAGGGAPVLVLV